MVHIVTIVDDAVSDIPRSGLVAQELNDRPRERLAFKKPIELIGDLLLR